MTDQQTRKMKKRLFYAANWGMGIVICANSGKPFGLTIVSSPDRSKLDMWVGEGSPCRYENDFRQTITRPQAEKLDWRAFHGEDEYDSCRIVALEDF